MNKEFEVHKLNEPGINNAKKIASMFNQLIEELKTVCPDGREFSIVRTKLEEACFFAKKSMASRTFNQAEE